MYFTYTCNMSRLVPDPPKDSLSVEIGNWFRASATGLGILAVPIVVLMVVAAAAARYLFG